MMLQILFSFLLVILSSVKAEHPFRLVLNHGGMSASHRTCNRTHKLFFVAEHADFEHECLPNEVDLIYDTIHATNRRHLKHNDNYDTCIHHCKEYKYGYCFVFFCQGSYLDELVEIPLEQCVSEFIAVNNAINGVLPLVSPSCQAVLAGGRDVACYDLEWRGRLLA